MPFGRSKTTHRTPLQRLNDSRRSLALAGLAGGAALAAIFRRKKGRGEDEFGAPSPAAASAPKPPIAPEPPTPAAPVESGPPAAIEVPPAPAQAKPGSIVEPATGELSAEEASILAVLAQSGRSDDDRTAIAVATSLERETTDVAAVLRKLGAEGVVSGELYTAAGDKIWAVTERGVRRLGAQH